jgi:hypothetical protein
MVGTIGKVSEKNRRLSQEVRMASGWCRDVGMVLGGPIPSKSNRKIGVGGGEGDERGNKSENASENGGNK